MHRDLGVTVGVGSHTPDEWRKALNGELMEMPGETYMQSDPARMYRVMRQTSKPCFAFKVLAPGRVREDDRKH